MEKNQRSNQSDQKPVGNLGVVVLSFNEAARIERCVKSFSDLANRFVLFDSESSDNTPEIALRAWVSSGRLAKDFVCIIQKWKGFLATRNGSIEWCSDLDWILWIDSDEWLDGEIKKQIREVCSQVNPEAAIYKLPRLSLYEGRKIFHSGWFPDKKRRLGFRRNIQWRAGPAGADVHEDLVVYDSVSDLPKEVFEIRTGFLMHEPFLSLAEHQETNRRYSTLLADAQFQKMKALGKFKKPSHLRIWVKTGIKFIENFIFKFGFLDGGPGFRICLESARSLNFRLKKLRLLIENSERQA